MGHSAPALVLATLCFVGPAAARDNCNIAYDFDQGALRLGKVKPVVRKTFFEPDNVNEPNVYVIGGDELVIGEQDGTYVCALYVNRKGVETMGWLKAADIEVSPVGDVPFKQWLGKWTAGEWHNIEIKRSKTPGWIDFVGEAAWAASEEAAQNGGLHEGGIGADAPIVNGVVGYSVKDWTSSEYVPYDEKAAERYMCAARLKVLSRRYLMVEDNRNCGGANVSSTGFYVRAK